MSRMALASLIGDAAPAPTDPEPPEPPVGGGTVMPNVAVWGDSLSNQPLYWQTIQSDLRAFYGQGTTVHSGGVGAQRSEGIAMRQGGVPGRLNAFTLPASGAVTISFSNMIDVLNSDVDPAVISGIGAWVGNVNPVHGKLSRVDNGSTSTGGGADCWPYRFTRDTSGVVRAVAAGENMTLDTADTYRQGGHVVRLGHNNRNTRPCTGGTSNLRATTYNYNRACYDWVTAPAGETPRCIVVGLFTADPANLPLGFPGRDAYIEEQKADVAFCNNQAAVGFGDDYCDIISYVASKQALVDAGIITAAQNPSIEDQKGIDGGYPPRSLQQPTSLTQPWGIHLNDAGQTVSGRFVAKKIIAQDWRRQN